MKRFKRNCLIITIICFVIAAVSLTGLISEINSCYAVQVFSGTKEEVAEQQAKRKQATAERKIYNYCIKHDMKVQQFDDFTMLNMSKELYSKLGKNRVMATMIHTNRKYKKPMVVIVLKGMKVRFAYMDFQKKDMSIPGLKLE